MSHTEEDKRYSSLRTWTLNTQNEEHADGRQAEGAWGLRGKGDEPKTCGRAGRTVPGRAARLRGLRRRSGAWGRVGAD